MGGAGGGLRAVKRGQREVEVRVRTHTRQDKHTNTPQLVTIDRRDRGTRLKTPVSVSEFLNVHCWVLFSIFDSFNSFRVSLDLCLSLVFAAGHEGVLQSRKQH